MGVPGRGRRPALPVDDTDFDGASVDLSSRIAWLLRVSRLLGEDSDLRLLGNFAKRLGDVDVATDPPKVSQWETGATPVTVRVLTGYERALGLPDGHLRGIVDVLRHSILSTATPAGQTPPMASEPQRNLDEVYDRTRAGIAQGGHWLQLADLMTGEYRALLPRALFEDLMFDLVKEMMRSVGTAYTARFEALCKLVADPQLSPTVLECVSVLIHEPGAQVIFDPISLMGEDTGPQNVRRLLGLLEHGTGAIRTGATLALLSMVAMRKFPGSEASDLESTLVGLLGGGVRDRELGRMLFERLPARSASRVERRVGVPGAEVQCLSSEPAADLPEQLLVVERIGSDVIQTVALQEDVLLLRLVRESLFSEMLERRHNSSLLLSASPYAALVATSVMDRLDQPASPPVRAALSQLLTYVVDDSHSSSLRSWLGSEGSSKRLTALRTLAHAGPLPATIDLMPFLLDEDTATAALYTAGMAGQHALETIGGNPECGLRLRQAATWWINTGSALHDRAN
jgi:hypothetical protein